MMVQWLVSSNYDLTYGAVSATSLLRSTREIILTDRLNRGEGSFNGIPVPKPPLEIHTLFRRRLGQVIHDALEETFSSEFSKALLETNPEFLQEFQEFPNDNPKAKLSQEVRTSRKLGKYLISGKYDLVLMGTLYDYKTKFSYAAKNTDYWDYTAQGSIYRWLNPEIILNPSARFIEIYLDWTEGKAAYSSTNPQSLENIIEIPLWSLEETEEFLVSKLEAIETYSSKPEEELPKCTDRELWAAPPEHKYYAKQGQSKATKNFGTDLVGAQLHLSSQGKGFINTTAGKVTKCLYCPAFPICSQKDELISEGRLIIK